MSDVRTPRSHTAMTEYFVERVILGSRWLLVPFHFCLLIAVVTLLAKSAQIAVMTFSQTLYLSEKDVIVASLSVIELALVASLLLMVVFSSYEGLVSRIDRHGQRKERLEWSGQVGFGVLKLKVMTSIAAISGVLLLEKVIDANGKQSHDIAWAAGAFALFVIASVVLGVMERFERAS